MRLKNYINEGRSKEVTFDFVQKYIKNNCKNALKGTKIFRGTPSYSEFFYFIQPKQSKERISPYADENYYNLLLSNLPSWKKFPPRNKSIICTTDEENAEVRTGKGLVYLVLPRDGAKIGVCPSIDIWWSFSESKINNLNEFNVVLDTLFYYMLPRSIRNSGLDRSYEQFVKACKMADDIEDKENVVSKSRMLSDSTWEWVLPYIWGEKKNLLDLIEETLSPDSNGFKLAKIGDTLPLNNEVWLDEDSIMVLYDEGNIGAKKLNLVD